MKKMLLPLFLVLFSSLSHAAINEILPQQLLALTGLEEKEIYKETEKSLEQHLFQDENSFVCGLQEYRVDYYQTHDDLLTSALKNFSIITEVLGPKANCQGYEYFMCSTQWSKLNSKWQVINTLCENDDDFGPIF